MILTKLEEALAAVPLERAELASRLSALDVLEAQLRSMIAQLSGSPVAEVPDAKVFLPTLSMPDSGRDRIDHIADILRSEGKPLHITVIATRLSSITGNRITRTEVEPGLNRHVTKAQKRRVAKFGPSI